MIIFPSGAPKGGIGDPDPHFFKYDSRDLSKNARKLSRKGVSPHLREFEGCGPTVFLGGPPTTKVLDAPLIFPLLLLHFMAHISFRNKALC